MDINIEIATKLFGWKWMVHKGLPVRKAGQPRGETLVRFFMPPIESLKGRQNRTWLEKHQPKEATGDEPLDYSYCSMSGPLFGGCPIYDDSLDMCAKIEAELEKRGLLEEYVKRLHGKWTANPKERCKAALETIEASL